MTPKEKAIELYNKMYDYSLFEEEAKRCAIIAVNEILKSNNDWDLEQNIWCDTGFFGDCQMYWIAVKQEIENL
jgi:hypothetical protein